MDIIDSYDGVKYFYFINETESSDVEVPKIRDIISSVKYFFPTEAVILNYLNSNEELNTEIYKSLFRLLSPMYNHCQTSKSFSNDYVIISTNIDLFVSVPYEYREGHLVRVYAYSDENNAPEIYEIGEDTYGDIILNELEFNFLATFDLLVSALAGRNSAISLTNTLQGNAFTTSYGNIKVGTDNYIQFPMYLLTSEDQNIIVKDKLYDEYPSDTFRKYFNAYEDYKICSYGYSLSYTPSVLMLLLPLSGEYSTKGTDMLITYSVVIDYLNNNTNSMRFYSPIICNVDSDSNLAINCIKEMVKKYNTRVAFGIFSSEMRIAISDTLDEEEVLLYYPHEYEGFECNHHIIYTGIPYSIYTAFVPFLTTTLSQQMFFLYTSAVRNKVIYEYVVKEVNERGFDTSLFLEVQTDGYNITNILNYVTNKMKSGVIVSLLVAKTSEEFLLEFCKQGYTSKDYKIVNMFLYGKDIKNNYRCSNGHYFWEAMYDINEEIDNVNSNYSMIMGKKYTQYSESTTLIAGSILSVLLNHYAFNEMKYVPSKEYPDNYTFDELTEAVYNSKIPEFPTIKITSSNHLSSSLALNQVIYNSTTDEYNEVRIYTMINEKPSNPYGLEFLLDSGNHYYVCNWKKYNTSKYEEDVLLVALCLSVSGSLKEIEYQGVDPIVSVIYNINDNGGIHGRFLVYQIYDTQSDKTVAVQVLKKVLEDNAAIIIGGYSSDIFYVMSDYLLPYNKTIWFPGAFEGQECRRNAYYTGPVSNQFTDAIINYLTKNSKIEKNIMLLGDNRIWASTIFTIIQNKIKANGYNIYSYAIPDFSDVEMAVREGLSKMKNGGTIITSYASNDFINIINYMEQNITVHGIYELIAVSGDRDIINRLTVTGKFDVILTASHFDENQVLYPELKEELFQYTSTTQLSMFGESCAAALLLWSSALQKSPKILLDYDLNPYLYGTTINLCDGPIKMNTNHYTSLYVSLGKMIPNQHSVEMVMIQKTAQSPMAWSWEIPETYGKVCDYNSSIGEIGELNAITILLGISQSGVRTDFDNGIKSIIELIVMNVNNEGGVLDKQLYLSSMDITSDDVECSSLIIEQLTATKYDVLFTTASSICLEAITSITQQLDVTIVSLGYNGGESCVKNIIYASRETSTIDRLINVHLRTNKDNTMIYSVIYTTETSSIAMFEYTEKFIKFKEIKVAFSVSIAPDYTDFDTILNNVIKNCPDGCTILFFGTNVNHVGMDKYYKEKSMTIDKYPILSYTTGEIMIGTNVSPFLSGQSYFTSINNEDSKQFIDSVKVYTDEQVTEVMENTYSILNMWIEAVRNIQMTNSSKVIPQMYNINYNSPEGSISLKTNNYLSHFFYIGKLSEDSSKFEIEYSASKAITPVAWKILTNSGSYTCDFSQESVGYYQKDMSCTVGILNSYSGKFMTTERAMTDGIVQAINEINEAGGVLQRKILMETRDPESNDDKYMDYAKELGKLDEVKAVFGTGRYAVEKLLAPIFDKYAKPFFYPGNSAGEFCSAYVFSLQSTTNQLTHGLEKFEFSQWNEYVVVQVPTNPYSTISTRSILSRLNIFQSVVHGPYNTTDFSQMDELSDEVLKRSNIVLSVGADGIPPSLSYFCDTRKLNARTIHIVVTTLDQRILDQLDQDCVEGLYFLSTFMTEMGISTSAKGTFIESAESFVTNMQNSYGADVQLSAAMEAGYTAVKLWADVVENTYSFDIEKARQRMYGYLYRSATGDLEMNVNGFASRVIYYGVVIQNKKINILNYAKTPEEALAYDNYLSENVGYTCDWTDKGDKYELESIKVIFLHEANKQESEIPIMLEESAMVKEINYNKINGYNVISEFVFGNSSEDFDYQLSKYDEDEEVVVYIGCRSVECREMAIKHSSKTGKLFYNLGITEGNYCYDNVINIGTTSYQRISLILNYAYTQSINLFYLVGDDSDVDKIDYDVANQYLKHNQSQNLRSYFITDKVITKSIVTTIMDKIITYSESERVGIIFTLKGERARIFLQYVVDSDYLAREIVFLFVEYHYHDYHAFDLSKFSGSYVSVSFHPVLKAALPQSYISDTQNNIGINTNITEEVEGVKIVLDLWQETMISSSSDSGNSLPSIDYMMVNTVGVSRSVPSGTTSIEDNSYTVRSIYVLEITTNGDLNQIEPYRDSATIDVNPNPYYISSIPSECKLGKKNVNFTYDNVLEIIFWLLLALACGGGLFCFIFTIGNQNKLIIRSFGRFYNYVLAFLLMVTPLSAIPIAIAPTEHNGICMARPLILGLCAKMLLMTMISKASKLYKKLKVTRTAIVTKVFI